MFLIRVEALKRGVKEGVTLAQNSAPELAEKATEYYVNKGINKLNKIFTSSKGSGIAQANKETKDIIKVIRSLENIGVLRELFKKISSQKGGFLNFLRPLMSAGLPLMKNVLRPLAKSVLIPLGVTAVASATDSSIQKKFGLGKTAMVISDKELEDIMKIVKPLEESCLLIKGVNETIKNDVKIQKGGFLGILLGTLGASLLGDMLAGKGVITRVDGVIRADERVIRGGDGVSSSS